MATILIIDDDPTTLGLLRTRLEKSGYKVREAKDGQEGLQMAQKERPDLVFLDVRMPKVDGWQVCRTLKSNPLTIECPVVMLTGCSQDTQELYGLQCGADEYITKPWDSRQLMDVTANLLKQSSAAHDARSDLSQQRIKRYVQRVVQLAGDLPKSPNTELMAGQLLRLGTTLLTNYQTAIAKNTPDFRLKIGLLDQQAGELIYWLGLVRDSKIAAPPDLPLLLAEGDVLRHIFSDAAKNAPLP